MISKRPFSTVSMFTAIVVSIFAISSIAIAQGRYANVYSRNQVSDVIRRAEDSSDRFRTDFRNQMNQNNGLSNSQKNQFNNNVARCEEALDRLRDHFNKNNTWWESRNQVQDVVSASQNVNTMMNVLPFRRYLESQWNQLRNDVNKLADTFDLPGLNGGGWNGGGGSPGGNYPGGNYPGGGYPGGTGRPVAPPNWARGTFYGTAPDGTQIALTIGTEGRVSADIGGTMHYGSFANGNYLNMGDSRSRVARQGDGFTTTRVDNGEIIAYSRRSGGGYPGNNYPGHNYPGGSGNQISPPSWARGTFYGTAPDGTRIVLTISGNGNVSANVGGTLHDGRFTQGNLLDMGDSLSQVTQQGNGILTTRTDNNERIYYRR